MSEKKLHRYYTNNDIIKYKGEVNTGEIVVDKENYITINKLIDKFLVKVQKGQIQVIDNTKEDDKAPQIPLVDYGDDLIDLQNKIDFVESEKKDNNLIEVETETVEKEKQSDDADKVEVETEKK